MTVITNFSLDEESRLAMSELKKRKVNVSKIVREAILKRYGEMMRDELNTSK